MASSDELREEAVTSEGDIVYIVLLETRCDFFDEGERSIKKVYPFVFDKDFSIGEVLEVRKFAENFEMGLKALHTKHRRQHRRKERRYK